jgi:hypothetical protein
MALPPGRKPLTDQDMINLLRSLATNHCGTDTELDLQKTADRFAELTNTGIEHLDPDKRSWYYDGDGTRRKKDG